MHQMLHRMKRGKNETIKIFTQKGEKCIVIIVILFIYLFFHFHLGNLFIRLRVINSFYFFQKIALPEVVCKMIST